MKRTLFRLTLAIPLSSVCVTALAGERRQPPVAVAPKPAATAVDPKAAVAKGIEWLAAHQQQNGGFGQGEEAGRMQGGNVDQANVADTSVAALAFLRSGSTPKAGAHQKHVLGAVQYVLAEVEASDEDSIFVTKVRGTRVQSKLGQAVDTFSALTLLTEVQNKMPSAAEDTRVHAAVAKILRKMKKNQNADGSFEKSGWAPALAQGLGTRALNNAAANGVAVDEKLREQAEDYAQSQIAGGQFKGEGSAGVGLYSAAATVGSLDSSNRANEMKRPALEKQARDGKTDAERKEARETLNRYDGAQASKKSAAGRLSEQLGDERFVAGFGNNGGEEFLSYMLVSETLAQKGGPEWQKWKERMEVNLSSVQNGDGSWTGHHCITGRTFVTSTALLVLLTNPNSKSITADVTGKKSS